MSETFSRLPSAEAFFEAGFEGGGETAPARVMIVVSGDVRGDGPTPAFVLLVDGEAFGAPVTLFADHQRGERQVVEIELDRPVGVVHCVGLQCFASGAMDEPTAEPARQLHVDGLSVDGMTGALDLAIWRSPAGRVELGAAPLTAGGTLFFILYRSGIGGVETAPATPANARVLVVASGDLRGQVAPAFSLSVDGEPFGALVPVAADHEKGERQVFEFVLEAEASALASLGVQYVKGERCALYLHGLSIDNVTCRPEDAEWWPLSGSVEAGRARLSEPGTLLFVLDPSALPPLEPAPVPDPAPGYPFPRPDDRAPLPRPRPPGSWSPLPRFGPRLGGGTPWAKLTIAAEIPPVLHGPRERR